MPLILPPGTYRGELPTWWLPDAPIGQAVELEVYGDRMSGRLQGAEGEAFEITIPLADQVAALRLSTAHGTVWISLTAGAVRVPVSCWASGDVVRLQVIGPAQFVQRRAHLRFAVQLPAHLGWLRPGDRAWAQARSHTVDLSLGGLQLAPATTVWPGFGISVQVLLELPDGPCQLAADVLGTTPDYGLRVVFTDLAPAAAGRLEQLAK
jgi:hypothetical protein